MFIDESFEYFFSYLEIYAYYTFFNLQKIYYSIFISRQA